MALFTDIEAITLKDLLRFESAIAQVASSQNISIEGKIELAKGAVGDRVMLWLSEGGDFENSSLFETQSLLDYVALTAPLKRWLCLEALARVYAEAYNVQLNTRFQGKWNEYQAEAKLAADLVQASGLGLVSGPLAQPATPLISIQSGNSPAQTLLVGVCWTDSAGNEGALSPTATVQLLQSSSFVAGMSEGALSAPASATGWNLYAGPAVTSLTAQNLAPLSIGSTWQMPASGLRIGALHSGGQHPAITKQFTRQLRRG